jgi:hypothetical protein
VATLGNDSDLSLVLQIIILDVVVIVGHHHDLK